MGTSTLLDKIMNDEHLRKAFETGDFASGVGLLSPEQNKRFFVLVKQFNVLMGLTRMVPMRNRTKDVEKLHVSEPITRAATENTLHPSPTELKTNKVELYAKKLISNWDITHETLQENIEQENFEDTVMEALIERISIDLEQLAIMGDEATVVTPGNAASSLLVANDGWYKKALSSHVLDVDGAPLTRGVFAEMLRMMPKQYRSDPNMRFIMSDSLYIDWQDLLAGGNNFAADSGAIGNDAIAGSALNTGNGGSAPYGKRILRAPLIPDDMDISTGAATSYAYAKGTQYSPFKIRGGDNDTLVVTTDSGGPVIVTFSAPATGKVFDLVEIVSVINTALAGIGGLAVDSGENQLMIRSTTDGAASSLTIDSEFAGSTANSTLGFPETGLTSTGAASAGTVPEGSFILLCNPMNLIWGMVEKIRVFSEYNKDLDRLETVVYNMLDFEIENLDAVVLARNVRKRSFV